MAYSPSSSNNLNWNPTDQAVCGAIPDVQYGANYQSSQQTPQQTGIGQQGLDNLKAQIDAKTQQIYAEKMKGNSQLGGGTIGGGSADYSNLPPPAPISHDCSHCGRCPNCGRGKYDYGYVPYYPHPIPYYSANYAGDYPGWPQHGPGCGNPAQMVSSNAGNENRIY